MVDIRDLKSLVLSTCEFESRPGHKISEAFFVSGEEANCLAYVEIRIGVRSETTSLRKVGVRRHETGSKIFFNRKIFLTAKYSIFCNQKIYFVTESRPGHKIKNLLSHCMKAGWFFSVRFLFPRTVFESGFFQCTDDVSQTEIFFRYERVFLRCR